MEPQLNTLANLLLEHPPALLVKAIDKHGLYGWDEFGVWGEFKKKSVTVALALNKLSAVYYAQIEASRHEPPRSWHGVLTGENIIGPLHHLGWLTGQMPDFKNIEKEVGSGPVFMPLDTPKMRDDTTRSIIGGLLSMLKEQPQKTSKDAVITQVNVIDYLLKNYADFPGISKSNLEKVFSEANTFTMTYTGKDGGKKG